MIHTGTPHSRRTKHVVGLGEGPRARKAIDLALRHAKSNFTSVELHPTPQPHANPLALRKALHGEYLRERGQKEKPRNLTIRTSTDALEYLTAQREKSIDHLYAHFLLQHLPYAKRQAVYQEALRTMRPGARFIMIEDAHYHTQLPKELTAAGFKVTAKFMTPEQLLKVGTDNGDMNAHHALEQRNLMHELKQQLDGPFRKFLPRGAPTFAQATAKDRGGVQDFIRQKFERLEGKNPPREVRKALDQILRDTSYVYNGNPFVLITAKKVR